MSKVTVVGHKLAPGVSSSRSSRDRSSSAQGSSSQEPARHRGAARHMLHTGAELMPGNPHFQHPSQDNRPETLSGRTRFYEGLCL